MKTGKNILLTGATGYVGGRLLRALEQAGYTVRCLARKPEYLKQRIGSTTEVVQGDCLVPSSLESAMQGIDAAYYMVHSMGSSGDFEDLDRQAAANFGQAAKNAGVRRIIYLGGLGESSEGLSAHLRSRQETGETLRSCGVPVVELRASIVLGSGSLSFELIRALVERLPVMICPSWVQVKAQPIAIEDVVAYLVQSLDLPDAGSQVFEIGGADQVSYAEIMREYARQRSLRRLFIPVPVLTPRLSSLWLGLTTPVYARVGRKLIEGVRNPTVVTNNDAMSAFEIRPMNLSAAIARAMRNEDQKFAMTRWSDSISSGSQPKSWGGTKFGSRLVDSRTTKTTAGPSAAFEPVRKLGGGNGWYYANWLWRLRGFIDLLVGGVGMRRGRRDPDDLKVGDALDFWRVEAYEPDHLLRLAAEMKLPGRAWLEYEVRPTDQGSEIRQTAVFDPVGLFGLIYWYGIYPLHSRIFGGMLRAVARRAESCES
jgi:uncharacterized protein YbjT (DUF2867 family)